MRYLAYELTVLTLFAGIAQGQQPIPNPDNLPVVHWQNADQYYGREAIVYGHVVLTRDIGFMTFLNFHRDYRRHFTVVIKREDYGAFARPPERLYYNKKIAARGQVIEYSNKPEIIVTSPDQITLLADNVDIPERVPVPVTEAPTEAGSVKPRGARVTLATIDLDGALSNGKSCLKNGGTLAVNPELALTAEIIRDLSADIVALQCAGSRACLEAFNETHLRDLAYDYVFAPDESGPKVGLLSRYPALRVESHKTFALKRGEIQNFSLPPLEAEIELPSRERVVIFILKVPTREDGVKGGQRLAEMRGFRQKLEDHFSSRPDAALVVCGGFHESLDGKLVSLLAGSGAHELTVPGYVPPGDGTADKPLIAELTDFMLVSALLESRYLPGSTRIIQKEGLPPAVSADFGMAAPVRTRQRRPARPGDDF